jgi:hypothetical protein
MPATQELAKEEVVEIISPAVDVHNARTNDNIVNLYSVGHKEVTRDMCDRGVEVPFQHMLLILGPQGETIRVAAIFDGCAMVGAMCVTVFDKVKHRLGEWKESERQLRMGNGVIVPSLAVWRGKMKLGEVMIEGEFEVFNSGGSWAFLLGKPLLRLFRAKQAYGSDTVSIRGDSNKKETLYNQITKARAGGDKPGINLMLDMKQHDIFIGGSSETKPPLREVLNNTPCNPLENSTDHATHPVYVTTEETPNPRVRIESIFTWETDPQNPDWVKKILEEVTIGPDITQEQRSAVQDLLRENSVV